MEGYKYKTNRGCYICIYACLVNIVYDCGLYMYQEQVYYKCDPFTLLI